LRAAAILLYYYIFVSSRAAPIPDRQRCRAGCQLAADSGCPLGPARPCRRKRSSDHRFAACRVVLQHSCFVACRDDFWFAVVGQDGILRPIGNRPNAANFQHSSVAASDSTFMSQTLPNRHPLGVAHRPPGRPGNAGGLAAGFLQLAQRRAMTWYATRVVIRVGEFFLKDAFPSRSFPARRATAALASPFRFLRSVKRRPGELALCPGTGQSLRASAPQRIHSLEIGKLHLLRLLKLFENLLEVGFTQALLPVFQ
jgi:hypothetical protein